MKSIHKFCAVAGALAIFGGAAPSFAQTTYEVRIPVTSASVAPAEPLSISLNAATLPEGEINIAYSFDFNTLLNVSGGDGGPLSLTWSSIGALPTGLALNASSGIVSGTPTVKETKAFDIVATHTDSADQEVYTIVVNGVALQVTQISLGDSHTCAVTTAGEAKCWGDNASGQLGTGNTTASNRPVTVSGLGSGVASITTGADYSCAIHGGAAKCWGGNGYGRLGTGNTTASNIPVTVSGLGSGVASIDAQDAHACAVTTAGEAKCWGYNFYGQLGDGTKTDRWSPVSVSGLGTGVASITLAESSTCALTTGGEVKCWGRNEKGQLGDGTKTDRVSPVTTLPSGAARISMRFGHACAVMTTGEAKCWGANVYGQLGDSTTTERLSPVTASALGSSVKDISVGNDYTCAVTTAGEAKCWGLNGMGQLGDGTGTNRPLPTTVSGLGSGVGSISTGNSHTCAARASGGAMCWGAMNFSGQLGNGTNTGTLTPVDVVP